MGKRGRPRQFAGPVIAIKVPAMLRLRIFAAALEQGKGVSELVREVLEEKYGNHAGKQPKPARIPYE